MRIKIVVVTAFFVLATISANAQTILPGWPKQQVIDSLRAHHLDFTDEKHDDGPMKSSLIVRSYMLGSDAAPMYIDLTGGDTVAIVTIGISNKTGFDYAFLSAAKEKELGHGEKNASGKDLSERWDLGDQVLIMNFSDSDQQITIMRLGKRQMAMTIPQLTDGYDDAAASAAYNSGDFAKVRQLTEPAAKVGNAQAEFVLGLLYFRGQGVEKDEAKAAELFGKASAQGHPVAEYLLASLCRAGVGVPMDTTRSFQLLQAASDSGFPNAQNALAIEYYSGKHFACDSAKALSLFQKAAAAGISEAQFYTGSMTFRGEGTSKDLKAAVEWLERAVLQRNTRALGFLVPIYMGGDGIQKDLARAYAYSHLAAKYDMIQAATSGAAVTEKWATPDDVAAAQKIMDDLEQKWKNL